MHIIQITPLITTRLLNPHGMLLLLHVEPLFPTAHFAVPADVGKVAAAPDPVLGERFGAAAEVVKVELAAVGYGVIFFDEGESTGVAGDGEEEEEEGEDHDCFVLGSVGGLVELVG